MKIRTYTLCTAMMATLWLVTYFSSGGGPRHEYGDAINYNIHVASIVNNQQFAPRSTTINELQTESDLGKPTPAYANEGYIFLRCIFSKLTNNTRLWQGSLLSLLLLTIAWPFFMDLASNFIPKNKLIFLSIVTALSPLWIRQAIRPLSDPAFAAFTIVLGWFCHKYPQKVILVGLILGVAMTIRIQSLFLLALTPILLLEHFSLKKAFITYAKLLAGFIMPMIVVLLIKKIFLILPESTGTHGNWYINYLVNERPSISIFIVFKHVWLTLWKLRFNFFLIALFALHCLPRYYHIQNRFLIRLGLFVIGSMALLLPAGCQDGETMPLRYLAVYSPFIVLIVVATFCKHVKSARIGIMILFAFLLYSGIAQRNWLNNCTLKLEKYRYAELEAKLANIPQNSIVASNNTDALQTIWSGRRIVRINNQSDITKVSKSDVIGAIVLFETETNSVYEQYKELHDLANAPVVYAKLNQ